VEDVLAWRERRLLNGWTSPGRGSTPPSSASPTRIVHAKLRAGRAGCRRETKASPRRTHLGL